MKDVVLDYPNRSANMFKLSYDTTMDNL